MISNCAACYYSIFESLRKRREMSDSESDSYLNLSHYDPEDNLNVYGSPVYSEQPRDNAAEEPPGPSNVVPVQSLFVFFELILMQFFSIC